jgi:hypothetical protein
LSVMFGVIFVGVELVDIIGTAWGVTFDVILISDGIQIPVI